MEYIFPGPSLETFVDVPSFPRELQQIYEGEQAVAVLKEVVDHILMRKFLGPFPPHIESFNVHCVDGEILVLVVNTIPVFVIPKQDSTRENPK